MKNNARNVFLKYFMLASLVTIALCLTIQLLFGRDILTASALGFIAGYFFRKWLYGEVIDSHSKVA